MQTITVNSMITLNQGVTSEEGQPIYEAIIKFLKEGEVVTLDFAGVTFLTTAFLNVVIGTLYKDYSSEQLKDILKLKNVSPETASRIKRVTDNAKSFYADQESFNQTIEEVVYGSM